MAIEVPDVVMTDMTMPGLAGAALINLIREQFPALPIVAMSGDEEGEYAVADVFLHKPFKLRDARAAIEAAMRKRGLA
jgi:DNA-binding NtrC family response regulator